MCLFSGRQVIECSVYGGDEKEGDVFLVEHSVAQQQFGEDKVTGMLSLNSDL